MFFWLSYICLTLMRPCLYLCLFVLVIPSIAVAQSWTELYRQAQTSYQSQDYANALTSANQALLIFSQEPAQKVESHAAILRLLENIYYETAEYEKGLQSAIKEVTVLENDKTNVYA